MGKFRVPLSEEKKKGPDTVMSFLEVEIDTLEIFFWLPSDKIAKIQSLADSFLLVTLKKRCNSYWVY